MQFKKNEKGYTFVELIAVMIIIALMVTSFSFGFLRRRGDRALYLSAHRLIQDLRIVQDRALAPLPRTEKDRLCEMEVPPETDLKEVIFGIHFSKRNDEYFLFVDCAGTQVYDQIWDKRVEPIGLERGIKILDLRAEEQMGEIEEVSIVFAPPNPEVFITPYPAVDTNGIATLNSIQVVISVASDESKTKEIKIHDSGFVEIID